MTEQLISAVIASSISVVGILISSIVNTRQIRQQEKNMDKQLRRGMTQRLYELRLKLYPLVFEITDRIKQFSAPRFINTKEELEQVLDELRIWKNGEVSLVLSNNSLQLYSKLRKELRRIPDGVEGFFSLEQAKCMIGAKAAFRRSLKKDLGFLFDEE